MSDDREPFEIITTPRFERRVREISVSLQRVCNRVILAIANHQPTPGQRIKPILPDKYFSEARLNRGDRLVFRIAEGRLSLVDIVSHDEIGRYGSR